MESSTVDTDSMEFFSKSGKLLFYYNMVTAEHRWPDKSNGYENGTRIFGRPRVLVCVATQTEDYGCSNGCTSVHVDGGLIQTNHVDNEDLLSSQLDEDLPPASGENEFQVLAEVNADSSPGSTTQSDVFENCALITSNNVENESPLAEGSQLESDEDVLPAPEQSDNTVFDGDGETTGVKAYEKAYECNICGNKYAWKVSLKLHEYIHTGIKPYECKTCGKRFTRQNTLKHHEYIHTGTKPYECKICDKRFRGKISLKQHEYVHAGKKPYECKACGKSFAAKRILTLHELIHTGTKPHECKTCGKCFTDKGVLKRHEYMHTGTKPYKCNTCGKSFTRNETLKQHESNHSRTKS